jgi:hypothetical protein
MIDVGAEEHGISRRYHAFRINIDLNPQESIDWPQRQRELQLEELLSRFDMKRQMDSENFYWYSNDARSRWLPEIAAALEDLLPEILEEFGITLSKRISVIYYDRRDYNTAYSADSAFPLEETWYSGRAGSRGYYTIHATRPQGSTTVTVGTISLLVHELIHVLQVNYITDWEAMNRMGLEWLSWVSEGTARYFEWSEWGYGRNLARPWIVDNVRGNRIPTLDYLEVDFFEKEIQGSYDWAGTIIEFISNTYGMEYVLEMNRRHGDFMGIFGFTRDEFMRQWHQYLRTNFR